MNMISSRQIELLKRIIEEYVRTVKPVSSKSLCEDMNCSSATIRSEMSALEELGLLEKTHTSSGRIPSEKGYRFYVDHIMQPKDLSEEDLGKLQVILNNNALTLSDVVTTSMKIISELTNYTAVVLGTSSSFNCVSRIEVVPLSDMKLIAIVITDKGHVEHRTMTIEEPVSLEEIKQTVDIINKIVIGTPIDEVSGKLELEVKPVINMYVKQHEVLYHAFYDAFNTFTTGTNVKFQGTNNILKQPEFQDDAKKIRDILNKFEDQELINNIKEEDSGINVYIGSETGFDEDVTIIKTKYSFHGEEGTIALIGPKRMEYDRVTSLLNYITDHMND